MQFFIPHYGAKSLVLSVETFFILGIGKIHDRYCLVNANDGTMKGGTYFPITVKKQVTATQVAEKCGLPLVIIVDSGGAFLPLQVYYYFASYNY